VRTPGIDRAGRTAANRSRSCRRRTLTLRKPSPTGVVMGPLIAVRHRGSPPRCSGAGRRRSRARRPPAGRSSHPMSTPVASRTSGSPPRPRTDPVAGDQDDLCVIGGDATRMNPSAAARIGRVPSEERAVRCVEARRPSPCLRRCALSPATRACHPCREDRGLLLLPTRRNFVAEGTAVTWHYDTRVRRTHTSTQNWPARPVDTGHIFPGADRPAGSRCRAAGPYPTTARSMHPWSMKDRESRSAMSPTSGGTSTTFTIRLAHGEPSGFSHTTSR
jgi:hypothetical protein